MSIDRSRLVKNYVSAMHEGDAAWFIGAGMSRSSGYVDWKGLLRDCAKELGLDVDLEHDLVAVAQYYLNRRMDRSKLNQIIKDEFSKPAHASDNHKIIGRLPVATIWTTNFDSLLENAITAANRVVDVKVRGEDIATHKKGRDVTLYKMHGDVAMPDKAIICKEDYERYASRHKVFQNALEGDLLNKTFLFLGFSFTDPNLEYMLGHLRTLLENSKREHYAIMRQARLDYSKGAESARLFEYARNKQRLQIEDLQRYSIQTHLIDKFGEITDILSSIEQLYCHKNIFVSGSANEFGDFGPDRMRDLTMQLGERLILKKYKLITGMGLNIGDSVVKGALLQLHKEGNLALEKHLMLRPFPRSLALEEDEDAFKRYRAEMISKSGCSIFICGNSRKHKESAGVLEEFQIALRLKKIPIPLGATGFAARKIWEWLLPDIDSIYSGKVSAEMFHRLNDPNLTNSELLDAVFDIVEAVSDLGLT
jgi:hypothetical protein